MVGVVKFSSPPGSYGPTPKLNFMQVFHGAKYGSGPEMLI